MLTVAGYSQKHVDNSGEVWAAYFNQGRIKEKWGTWLDVQARSIDHVSDFWQVIFRPGVVFYASEDLRFTAGYAFVYVNPSESRNKVIEHRPWQQVMWVAKRNRVKITQALRTEQRLRRVFFSDNVYDDRFNWRTRYSIAIQIPLQKMEVPKWQLVLSNEIMINSGKDVVYNVFDQNRAFAGFNYFFSESSWIQFGYMNYFQQLDAGNKYHERHVARVSYFQSLDFR